jgi:outer membrane protein assembly factor BamB
MHGALPFVLAVIALLAGLVSAGEGPAGAASPARRAAAIATDSNELLYVNEGNRMRRIDVDTIGQPSLVEDVYIENHNSDPNGRDVNGEICKRPNAPGFVVSEDTGQPHPVPGWGVFDGSGSQIGKLSATYNVTGAEPHGCAFAPDGTLFTTEVGFQGFGTANGQLIEWFPPYEQFPGPPGAYPDTDAISTNFCKIATDLGTAGSVVADSQGRLYVAESSGLRIDRFTGPFPTAPNAAGGCGRTDATGAPLADSVDREVFATPADGMLTFSGLAFAPNGNLYAASVFTGRIAEYDLGGNLVRLLLAPDDATLPIPTGTPQGLAVGKDGTVYYADLNLEGTLPDVGPGPNGKVWRIRFDSAGDPMPPELVRQGLAFPDGLTLFPGDLQSAIPPALEWPTLAGGPERRFFNANEHTLTSANASSLIERWRFPTGAVVTSSPTIASVDLPGRGRTRAVFFSSWDGHVYALDWATGAELWRFAYEDQPGASFPGGGSVTVADVGGRRVALFGAGEKVYALDAASGDEVWHFAAGTGCRDAQTGQFPGLCSFQGERNEVESTPIVVDDVVYFGMDINDVARGKGGFYALDGQTGTLRWFFDPESGAVCRPDATDEIRAYDGYHSEAELGLPSGFLAGRESGFLAGREGCDHPRTPNGCGNIWSSPAYDSSRSLLYFGTSNCDTDDDPATPVPAPPMPQYDEALVALHTDGSPAWKWRPREIDNDDLAFGATPNLFHIIVDGASRDAVGIGSKDGTYYVLDRDGTNAHNGATWNGADAADLPYWRTKLVEGGDAGGIIGTASVDEAARRVYISTAPQDITDPQHPSVHALDLDTGAVRWDNAGATGSAADASFGPTSAVPGVVIVGSVVTPHLRMYDAADGKLLVDRMVGRPGSFSGVASGAAVVDGTVIVGAGIGTRSSGGSSPGDFTANSPSAVVALCVPGTPGCAPPVVEPGGAAVVEGNSGTRTMSVPVSLSRAIGQPVTVQWKTLSYEATSPSDFTAASGQVTFAPLETSKTVNVAIKGDTVVEGDETLLVSFSKPVGATLGGFLGLAPGIIVDDEPGPKIQPGLASVVEGDRGPTTIQIPVSLSAPSTATVSVKWTTRAGSATAPADFVAGSGSLTFAPGVTQARIPITVNGDEIDEPDEYFVVALSEPKNARLGGWLGMAFGFITDDD